MWNAAIISALLVMKQDKTTRGKEFSLETVKVLSRQRHNTHPNLFWWIKKEIPVSADPSFRFFVLLKNPQNKHTPQ